MEHPFVERARDAEREGRWEEAVRHYEGALHELLRAPEPGPAIVADLLRWIGTAWRQKGELELAMELYEASLAVAVASSLPQRGDALNCMGAVEQLRGGLDRAEAYYQQALQVPELTGPRLPAMVRQNLATLATIRGDLPAALEQYGAVLAIFEEIGDELAVASVRNNRGMVHVDLGQWDEAAACFDAAAAWAERAGDDPTLGHVELNRAELHLRMRDFDRARDACDRAFEIFSRVESHHSLAEAHKLYGMLCRDTMKSGLAEIHFSSSVELARQLEDSLLEAEALAEWALLQWEEGRRRQAIRSLNRAWNLFTELGAKREIHDLEGRLQGIEGTYLSLVRAWGESIEAKDHYTAGHCERVANLACALAEECGITGHELTWFRMGAFLHDVGKIEVSAEVLNKPGAFTPEERRHMEMHTVAGHRIVTELDFPRAIREIVRSHHEHWDGRGYPDGLKGEEIPLSARILGVADVYDALTTTRSYRRALSHAEAMEIMEKGNGSHFEPQLFARFRRLVTRLEVPVELLSEAAPQPASALS